MELYSRTFFFMYLSQSIYYMFLDNSGLRNGKLGTVFLVCLSASVREGLTSGDFG